MIYQLLIKSVIIHVCLDVLGLLQYMSRLVFSENTAIMLCGECYVDGVAASPSH